MLTDSADIATIIGTGVAIISVIVAIWLNNRSRQRRALSYALESLVPLTIDSASSVKDDLQILYNEKIVNSLYVIRVGIKNTGGPASSIKRSDLIDPIKFNFKPGTKILSEPKVIKRYPENIDVDIFLESSQNNGDKDIANLTFDLLNASWEIIIEFIYSGQNNPPNVIAKISEIQKINRYRFDNQVLISKKIRSFLFAISFLLFSITIIFLSPPMFSLFTSLSYFIVGVSIGVSIASGLFALIANINEFSKIHKKSR